MGGRIIAGKTDSQELGMQLYSVTFNGYKRLRDTWINLEGNTNAIVGPNEAGKSSILEAMSLLNNDDRVPAGRISRGDTPPDDHPIIIARYRLEADERVVGSEPLPDGQGIWLIVTKTVGGERNYRLDPPARRDPVARIAAMARLERSVAQPWFARWVQSLPDDGIDDLAREVQRVLSTADDTVDPSGLDTTRGLRDAVDARIGSGSETTTTGVRELEALRGALDKAIDAEAAPHPSSITDGLRGRVPLFVDFNDDNRSLNSEYNLNDPADFARPALANFAAMAGLPLVRLRDAINGGDHGTVRSILERSQRSLVSELRNAWRQSPLTVSFDREGSVIRITVSSDDTEYFRLDDRSAGMRTFIALRAFLAQGEYAIPPILMVDEAETHLHYEAQADLIRVFEHQELVAKVVYTTHSIGCLPQDLGRGVRVVSPRPDSTRSDIENVWARNDSGLNPLMHAMGAGTVPLTPSRRVVIAEGPSDPMLLPSLLREASGLRTLDFQVVDGLAEASDAELARLDSEAPFVAYLVDGDASGRKLAQKLTALGVASNKIVALSPPAQGLVIEDLLDPGLYAEAVNGYLKAWPPNKSGIETRSLPRSGRPTAVDNWCVGQGLAKPSHLRIAEEVLRLLDQPSNGLDARRIGDARRRDTLTGIHARLAQALGLDV
jgi:hypothetical protein